MAEGEGRAERLARNEARFREINERLQRDMRQLPEEPPTVEFICECGDGGCTAAVALTLEEYERARAEPHRFVVLPGHEIEDVETVVSTGPRYSLVEKHAGGGTDVAARTDPRR